MSPAPQRDAPTRPNLPNLPSRSRREDATRWEVSISSGGEQRIGLKLSAPPPPSADHEAGPFLILRLDVRRARKLAHVLTAYAAEADEGGS